MRHPPLETPNHPNQRCDTHTQSLSPAQSVFYAWEKNLKGKTPQNIPVPVPMYMEGNKSYWALHVICWKVQARQLIIITAFNTEPPLLLFEGVSAGRTWLMELLTRAYHVQQQQDCHSPPLCSNHPLNTGFFAPQMAQWLCKYTCSHFTDYVTVN